MNDSKLKYECTMSTEKDPKDMTPEELKHFRSLHDPDKMGYCDKEGVDEDE